MMPSLRTTFLVDGLLFAAIGAVVLARPSAAPTLAVSPGPGELPLEDTRRLLASQYLTVGGLAVLLGLRAPSAAFLVQASRLRALSLGVVLGVNVSQLRRGAWKPRSLYAVMCVLVPLGLVHAVYGSRPVAAPGRR